MINKTTKKEMEMLKADLISAEENADEIEKMLIIMTGKPVVSFWLLEGLKCYYNSIFELTAEIEQLKKSVQ